MDYGTTWNGDEFVVDVYISRIVNEVVFSAGTELKCFHTHTFARSYRAPGYWVSNFDYFLFISFIDQLKISYFMYQPILVHLQFNMSTHAVPRFTWQIVMKSR